MKTKKKLKRLGEFLIGWKFYLQTGKTQEQAYQAMRSVYFMSNGIIFDIIWALIQLCCRKVTLSSREGILSRRNIQEADVLEQLNKNGLFICEKALEEDTVAQLLALSKMVPAHARNADEPIPDAPINFEQPVSNLYDLNGEALVNNATVQSIISDYSLISVAQNYLKTRPLLQNVTMWWSMAPSDMAIDLNRSAQQFHTDLDTIQWLNFFFYLTDVDDQNGPHVFVRGSHRRKPKAVQRDGRIPDAEVATHYPANDILTICAPKGSMIIADTKALHKGNHLEPGNSRLMFQIRFAITRFGAECPVLKVHNATLTPALGSAMASYPQIYRDYLVQT